MQISRASIGYVFENARACICMCNMSVRSYVYVRDELAVTLPYL